LWHGQRGKDPTEDIDEDEIFYSTDPITTVAKALKKANIEYLGLLSKRPLTQEDKARIVELQNIITNFGVSGISHIFISYDNFISVFLFYIFYMI
jgi:hypothetical protein